MSEYSLSAMEHNPSTTGTWTPAERELASALRATQSIREISESLKAHGYNRNPKQVEKFFERTGLTKKAAMEQAGITNEPEPVEEDDYTIGPLKTTWGRPMLVDRVDIEWGTNTDVVPVVFIPDIHAPFHDPQAVELACKVIETVKPVKIVYIGDNVDWVQLSRFDKDPERVNKTQDEVDSFHQVDRQFMSAAGRECRRYWLLGNHEKRLYKYYCSNPEISQVRGMQADHLLGLTPKLKPVHNLQIVEDEIVWRNRFIAKHGNLVRKWSGVTAHAELDVEHMNGVSGHTHRAGQYCVTQRGKTMEWTELGCLCDLDPTYMRNPNWQHAMGVAWFNGNGKNDFYQMNLVKFSNYQTIVQGQYLSV